MSEYVNQNTDEKLERNLQQNENHNHLPGKTGLTAAAPQSAFAEYTSWQIVRTFWRLYLIVLAVSLGGMYAGYCGSAIGNIVANPGEPHVFVDECTEPLLTDV